MKSTFVTSHKMEKGQILVTMALIFVGLVAVIGLAIDLGNLYVSHAHLRRAVQAAAQTNTAQFKKNVPAATLQKAAHEFLALNGVSNETVAGTQVETCAT